LYEVNVNGLDAMVVDWWWQTTARFPRQSQLLLRKDLGKLAGILSSCHQNQ
jgi:hypothetical protein